MLVSDRVINRCMVMLNKVLILVLVDVGLGPRCLCAFEGLERNVLILVLVDVGLGLANEKGSLIQLDVLILVLVDVGLGPQ